MTTLAQVFAEAETKHPNMARLGPPAWAELHAWADRFAAQVGDSCGCGVFAQDAARAVHDLVNHKLGKKVMYPETFLEMANWYYGVARSMRGAPIQMYQEAVGRLPSGGATVAAQARAAEMSVGTARQLPSLDTFLASKSPMERRRIRTILDKKVNYGGSVMTRREFVEQSAAKGLEAKQFTVTEGRGKGTFWSIGDFQATKLEVDYLNHLRAKPSVTQANLYPWPEGMFEDEDDDEEDGDEGTRHSQQLKYFRSELFPSEQEARAWITRVRALENTPGYLLPGVPKSQFDIAKWPESWEPVEGEETWEVQYWTGTRPEPPHLDAGGLRKGALTAGQLQALRHVTRSMGGLVKEVLTRDPGLLYFNVTLPGPEALALELKPQYPEREQAAKKTMPDLTLQPAMFNSFAHFSQSFLDTILHTAVGAATALAVTKALSPGTPNIKEGEKPPSAPVPSVLSPAHVEGDQANVDLGTLLEEIDAILKKPETMGIVDADTLTILRE